MVYRDMYEDVGNFLFAHGENPFTTKALESTKPISRQSGRLSVLLVDWAS